ncbi:MAG: barstar family protein, partial [Mycobacteriales bacterium]
MTERDPMAEIARLRLPAGPHVHLLDGAPADARALGWMLATVGLVTRALRGPCMRTAFGLYDEIGAAVQLPGDPVEDWADIGALLVDLSWLPADGHVLVVTDAALVLAAEPASFAAWCGMIDDVAHRRTAELDIGSPRPFHVVLQDDPSGLAGLRARLSEAAVSYDELLGWERQEPAGSPGGAGVRVSYQPGDAGLDGIDRAAGAAIGQRPDVLEVRRAVQVFRADTRTRVRVYGAVLNRFDRVGEVTRELADAVAPSGAQLMVMSDIVAARGPRQEAFLAAAGLVWPLPAEPVTAPEQPEPAQPEPAQPEQAEGPEPAQPEQAERPEPAQPEQAERPEPEQPKQAEGPEPELPEPELPDQPSTVDDSVDRPTASSRPDGGADPTAFQIVAADLGWSYEPGRPEHDPVDSALCLLGADQPLIAGLWRCWCVRPDDGGYVRTVLASTHRGPLEADLVRRQVVDTLRDAGAGECCAEVVP